MKRTAYLMLVLLLVYALAVPGLAYNEIMTPGGELPIVTGDYQC